MFVIPEEDRSDKWFESFRKFIVQIAPEWNQDEKGATSEDIKQLEEKCCLADGIKLPLPKEYITYLQNMGGKYVSFRYKQIEFSYDPIYNLNQAGCFSGTLGSPYLAIASQDIDSCEELCYFLRANEYCTEAPLIMTQWGERETIKIADSLRQYLCCQAFWLWETDNFHSNMSIA